MIFFLQTITALFWMALLPTFGSSNTLNDLLHDLKFGFNSLQRPIVFTRATLFILFYLVSLISDKRIIFSFIQ